MYKKRETRFNWELSICIFFLAGFMYLDHKKVVCMGTQDFIILSGITIVSIALGKFFKCYKNG